MPSFRCGTPGERAQKQWAVVLEWFFTIKASPGRRWRQEANMKVFLGLIMAAALALPAQAGLTVVPGASGAGSVILVEGGCGPDGHRDRDGYCRPNWHEDRGVCPRGYHLGGEGRRCWPN
jgi:hypothetical protein